MDRPTSLATSLRAWNHFWTTTLTSIRPRAIGIDLGSEISKATGPRVDPDVFLLPSSVAIHVEAEAIVAIGEAARRMIGRVPQALEICSPIQQGVIAHPLQAEVLIRHMISSTRIRSPLFRPHVVIAAPAYATSVQRRAIVMCAKSAGAGRVSLVPEILAAAIGCELPFLKAAATLLIEMGAQKTEVAVLSLGGVVTSETIPIGGAQLSDAIALHLRRQHHLIIGRQTADDIKHAIGSAFASNAVQTIRARGQDARRGAPAAIEIKSDALVKPIREVLASISTALHKVLERTPPELCADLSDTGIVLSGGASRLQGLADYFGDSVGLSVHSVPDPERSVVLGCKRIASDPGLLAELGLVED